MRRSWTRPSADRLADRLLASALIAFACLSAASIATLQVAHLRDKFQVTENAGTWMALAQDVTRGTLYPPLYDGQHYGGTRYMPVPIVLHGGLGRLTDDLILSGKLVTCAFALALAVLLVAALRRRGCSLPASLALTAGVFVSGTGLLAATGMHFDVLSVVFQLAALALIDRSRAPASVAGAGVLCALSVTSKLSAVWGLLAIGAWLAVRDRGRLALFLGAFAASLGAAVGVFELASRGRMLTNVLTLSFAGYGGHSDLAEIPGRIGLGAETLFSYWRTRGEVSFALLPVAALALVVAFTRRRATVYELALPAAVAVSVVIFGDGGADYNHVLDVVVLVVLVVGGLWAAAGERAREVSWTRLALAALLLGSAAWSYHREVSAETRAAAKQLLGRGMLSAYERQPFAGCVSRDDPILSDDPYVSVSFGRRPVVLDLFMLEALGRKHPDWIEALAGRVRSQEFAAILLRFPLAQFYDEGFFGLPVNREIRRGYRLAERAGPYWIYRPVSRPKAGARTRSPCRTGSAAGRRAGRRPARSLVASG